jgi:hypothetical protein
MIADVVLLCDQGYIEMLEYAEKSAEASVVIIW